MPQHREKIWRKWTACRYSGGIGPGRTHPTSASAIFIYGKWVQGQNCHMHWLQHIRAPAVFTEVVAHKLSLFPNDPHFPATEELKQPDAPEEV